MCLICPVRHVRAAAGCSPMRKFVLGFFLGGGATQTLPTIQQRPALTWPRGDDAGPEFKLWRVGRTWCWCRRLGCPQCATCLQRWKLCKPSDNNRNEASIKTFHPSSSLIYRAKHKKKAFWVFLRLGTFLTVQDGLVPTFRRAIQEVTRPSDSHSGQMWQWGFDSLV